MSILQPRFDTTIRLARELMRRGWSVDYCDARNTHPERDTKAFLNHLPGQEILSVDPSRDNFLDLDKARNVHAQDYALILQRKDPPVDDFYSALCRHFSQLPDSILQINNPDQTWRYSEHGLPRDYPEFSIPTQLCESAASFIEAVRLQEDEAVAKPENECSGVGIAFFKRTAPEAELRAYWEERKPRILVQPFIKDIEKLGDLRILVMNGKVMGQVLRVPRPGSRLANLHQGATSRAYTPSDFQLQACAVIGQDLARKGLYLLGLDFIGEQISEINITCPSAMAQINEVMNIRAEIPLVNEIEKLLYLKQHPA